MEKEAKLGIVLVVFVAIICVYFVVQSLNPTFSDMNSNDIESTQQQTSAETVSTATVPIVNDANKTISVSAPVDKISTKTKTQPVPVVTSNQGCSSDSIFLQKVNKCVTFLEWCRSYNGQNATYNSTNNSCGCLTGYALNDGICTAQKSGHEVCGDMNATWDGVSYLGNGVFNCVCKSGYTSSADGKTCVVAKSGYQVCSEQFPNETWDGTYGSNGQYNCVCKSGYVWSGNSCQLYTPPSESLACQTAKQKLQTAQEQYNTFYKSNPLNLSGLQGANSVALMSSGSGVQLGQTLVGQQQALANIVQNAIQEVQIACQNY